MEKRTTMLEKLRVWVIHKLKGITPEEIKLPEPSPAKAYTVIPKKITARMILNAGHEYSPALVQQRLSYLLMDAVVDNGFVNFYSADEPADYEHHTIRADLWVVKKEE